MGKAILSDIRVLDFTRVLAGPYATRLLGDFGAEVIKVQSRKVPGTAEDSKGAYFHAWNRNKRSITLNMGHPEARELLFMLVSISDVVIENFTSRVMANWNVGYEAFREVREDLIMLSMSGLGHTGPWKDYTAYGPTIQSLSGLTYLTSYDIDIPVGLGFSHADAIAGLYGAFAVLAALEYRDKTGLGQFIDLSEYEASCTLLGPVFLDLTANLREILPHGNRSGYVSAAPYGCYPCQGEDNWCAIAVFHEDEWKALCKIMGDPRWAGMYRFSTMAGRKTHEDELDRHMERWTVQYEAVEVVKRLQEAKIPCGVVQNAEHLSKDLHLAARRFFKEIESPLSGETRADACPIKFRSGTEGPWKPSPLLGADNHYVYGELLGLSDEAIDSYMEKGVLY